jgi:SAM-dependent methyltransferase
MHAEAMNFLISTRSSMGDISHARIVDMGALNVNGSAREVFTPVAEYIGVDVLEGNGVDIVSDCRHYDGKQSFDICISTEAMEHDPEPESIAQCAWRALKPGGLFILTAAAPPRQEHRCDGGLGDMQGEHYGNITEEHLTQILADWDDVSILYNPAHGDIYATAQKPKS